MSAELRSLSGQARKRPHRSAFTLVELLVVISIIALLISILLPSLKKAREQARTVKCLSNLRSIGMGVQLYAQDHSSVLPGPLHPPICRDTAGSAENNTVGLWPNGAMSPTTERPWFLLYRLAPYFTTQYDNYLEYTDAVATCPTQEFKNPDENFTPNTNPHGNGNNPSYSRPYHYLPNSWSNTAPIYYFGWVNIGVTWTGYVNGLCPQEKPYSVNPSGCGAGYYRPKPLDLIKNTSAEWAIGDAGHFGKAKAVGWTPGPGSQWVALGTWQLIDGSGARTGPSSLPLLNKPVHLGDRGTNLVFFDSHAETFMGTTSWGGHYPANLRTGLKRSE